MRLRSPSQIAGFLALVFLAGLFIVSANYNTSGRWIGTGDVIIPDNAAYNSRVSSITFTTDGVGDGEIVFPAGAVGTADILDDSITFADISDLSAIDADTVFGAADGISLEFLVTATAGATDFFVINANQTDDANNTDAFRAMVLELISESGDAGDTFGGIAIEVEDGTANTVIDYAISIDNAEDTASTLTSGIIMTSTTDQGIVTAINVSDAEIQYALDVGENIIKGGNDEQLRIGKTNAQFEFSVNGADTVTLIGKDATGASDLLIDTTSTGTITVGSAEVTAVTITTDDTGDGTDLVLPAGAVGRAEMTKAGRSTFNICGDADTVNNNTIYYGPSITLLANTSGGQTCDINAAGNATEATADAPIYTNQAVEVLAMTCRNEADANADISFTLRTAAGATVPSVVCTISDGERDCVADVQTTTDIAAAATVAVAAASTTNVGANNGFVCQIEVAF